ARRRRCVPGRALREPPGGRRGGDGGHSGGPEAPAPGRPLASGERPRPVARGARLAGPGARRRRQRGDRSADRPRRLGRGVGCGVGADAPGEPARAGEPDPRGGQALRRLRRRNDRLAVELGRPARVGDPAAAGLRGLQGGDREPDPDDRTQLREGRRARLRGRAGHRQDAHVGDLGRRPRRDRGGERGPGAGRDGSSRGGRPRDHVPRVRLVPAPDRSDPRRQRCEQHSLSRGGRARVAEAARARPRGCLTPSRHSSTIRTPGHYADNRSHVDEACSIGLADPGTGGRRPRRGGRPPPGDQEVVRHERGPPRRRPDRPPGRARGHLRAVGLGQVHAAPDDQPARGAERRLRPGARRRVRAGGAEEAAGQPGRAAPAGRDGLPAVQPVPAPDRAPQRRAGAPGGEGDAQGGGGGARRPVAQAGRPAALRSSLPGRALRGPAAARRDRPGAQPRPAGDALRRAHVGARRRARRRGAGGHARGRRVGDDDGDRHARARLRPRDRRLQRVHGRGRDRRVGAPRLLRQLHEPAHAAVHGGRPVMLASYDWGLIWTHRGEFLDGLATALEVSAVAIVISVFVGLLLALARMSRPPLSWAAAVYINVFRGVPALVSVIWVYFGWSLLLGINFSVFQAGVIALVLLYGAFISEIYRAALEAIPRVQREAGLAVGMQPIRVFVQVVLPQATKIAIPNIGSMFIGMVKDTSTFTVIGLLEVVRVTQNLNSTTFQPFVLYTAAAGLYVVVAFALDFLFRGIER